MPGRQSHGRSLMPGAPAGGAGAGAKSRQKSKAKSNKRSLNAFAEASTTHAEKSKRTPRNRELDAELSSGKHARQDDDEDDEDDDEEERPRKQMRRAGGDDDDNVEYGSDSSGNEWRIGVAEDDDSDLDSDEAFGESDEERFEGYAFGGSSAKNKKKKKKDDDDSDDDDEEDDEDDDGASLGSDAIDLAQALDMSMSEDDGPDEGNESESGDEDEDDSAESGSDEDEDDSEVDEAGVKDFVKKFSGVDGDEEEEEEEEPAAPTKTKIDLKDLGLLGVKDPQLKQSVKLLTKEQKSSKPQKLDVPLARRAQDRVDRAAAYDKTNQTLDRWTETVKQNRRADHLVFPLPQTETGLARHDNSEIRPMTKPGQGTELEQSILGLLEQSGLGPKAEQEKQNLLEDDDDEAQTLSRKALWQEKRRERELKSREDARAKRLKKIKSKTFNRIHRKQREKEDMKEHEARLAAGEIDSEDEREVQDRQRAMERMGARHKESKWAKMANKNGRAAWDEDVRVGIADMARRDEELRRRVEGKPAAGSDDESSDYDSEDDDDRKRILMDLDKTDGDDDGPNSKIMNLPFMKKSEAAKKRANDELVKQIRRELGSDDEGSDSAQEGDVGRKTYGTNGVLARPEKQKKAKTSKEEMAEAFGKIVAAQNEERGGGNKQAEAAAPELVIKPTQGAWSAAPAEKPRKRGKKAADSSVNVLDLDSTVAIRAPEPEEKAKPVVQRRTITADDDSSDDGEGHMPIRFSERELLDKAFGGLDVVADFEKEKEDLVEEQDEKMVDQTLPGWGSWVGEGVSEREKKRHHGRFMKKQEGVKKSDRKDAKLKNVIVNEKRIKKNNKYLASQLPHQYESQAQYEGALRLPLGPNWVTKQTHQEATKPRVMVKQGIIAPMSKPMH